jgi:hypothetical protein
VSLKLKLTSSFLPSSLPSLSPDPIYGLSTWTTASLPAETTVISLPFNLAVTPELAESAILALLGGGQENDVESWKEAVVALEERVKVLVYLVLHWIGEETDSSIE